MSRQNRKTAPYRLGYVAAAAMTLAACAKEPPPAPIFITKEAPPYTAPVECDPKTDPAWVDPPDADVHLKQSARIVRQNKQGHIDVQSKRTICWSAYEAYRRTSTATGDSHNGKRG